MTTTPVASSWADIVKRSNLPETKDNQGQIEDKASSNLKATAKAFVPSSTEYYDISGPENAMPTSQGFDEAPAEIWNWYADEVASQQFAMNANAKEFTPGLGLSEFGQTVEGWQT